MTAHIQDFTSEESTKKSIDLTIWQDTKQKSTRMLGVFGSFFRPIIIYFREDLCRAVFMLSIIILVVSAGSYHLAWVNKTAMQQYLILKETKEAKKRKYDVLTRNIAELEALGSMPLFQEVTRDKALGNLSNIKRYLSTSEGTASSLLFKDTIEELITVLQRSDDRAISDNSKVPDRKVWNYIYLNNLAALKAFALKEKEVMGANEKHLHSDLRQELVGDVGLFNAIMDSAAYVGLIFLVMTIACIPGLGKYTRTGFV